MAEEEYELPPELVAKISKRSIEEADKLTRIMEPLISELNKIREAIENNMVPGVEIKRLNESSTKDLACYAIDSSFRKPLPLVIGDLFVVIAGYLRFPRAKTKYPEINRGLDVLIMFEDELSSRLQSIISKFAEIQIALRILNNDMFNKNDWNILMIDGSIIPTWPTVLLMRSKYEARDHIEKLERDYGGKLLNMIRELYELCAARKKTLIGIIKRVRSHIISRGIIGCLKQKRVLTHTHSRVMTALENANDKALATLLLNPGEALLVGNLDKSEIIRKTVESFRRGIAFKQFLEENPKAKSVEICFLKPQRSKHIIRVEIFDCAQIGRENILTWLNQISTHTACPCVLDAVDKYVAMTNIVYELVRKIVIRTIAKKLSKKFQRKELDKVDLLLELADLQKKYIPDMG